MTEARKRNSLSKRLRFDVFKRDGFACQYCGAHPPAAILECDHVIPVAEGGGDDIDNLVTACFDCNRGKAAIPLTVVPQSLAEKAAAIAEREEQLRGYAEVMEARRQRLEGQTWHVMDLLYPNADTVPRDSFNSTRTFIEKLGFHAVYEAAEIALVGPASGKQMFRYFCGICWNKVREGGAHG